MISMNKQRSPVKKIIEGPTDHNDKVYRWASNLHDELKGTSSTG